MTEFLTTEEREAAAVAAENWPQGRSGDNFFQKIRCYNYQDAAKILKSSPGKAASG